MNIAIVSTLIIAILNAIYFYDAEATMTKEQIQKMMNSLGKTCVSKSGVSPEMQEAHKRREFPEDRGLKCYFGCMVKMSKVVDKNNKIDVDGTINQMKAFLPDDIQDSGVDAFCKCYPGALGFDDLCDIGYHLAKCHYELDSKSYFYP
ncbi:general odorant-binding protein 72-like [Cotesia typhae]|uniref:general odorant-binding protein 72-like n=1 Tax=Cotesia typhae TaxID=2053667 RepID=UPI003D69D9B1